MMRGTNRDVRSILHLIPDRSVGIELGVWRGATSELLLPRARELHLVDAWSIEPYAEDPDVWEDYAARYGDGREVWQMQREYDLIYQGLCDRFHGLPVTLHRMTTAAFFARGGVKADWIYVDASHEYADVLADLRGAAQCAPLILGDDYGNKPGVKQAVDEFAAERGLTVERHGRQQYVLRGYCGGEL
jgi:hypothetical protein